MLRALMLTGLLLGTATAAAAPAPEAPTVETTRVKTRKADRPDHPSLRFLRDNRDFLRSQLDRLRLETSLDRQGRADPLDARQLRLREMAAAIAAARDTVDHAGAELERRQLLASVGQLRDLELQLDLMDSLVADQGLRLGWLENDFLGRQETALVVLVRGDAGQAAPGGLVLSEDGDNLHIALDETARASLTRGGIVQIEHRLVEPRSHTLTVGFTGAAWADHPGAAVQVEAPRDQLTFLELDLSRLDPRQPGAQLVVGVWQR